MEKALLIAQMKYKRIGYFLLLSLILVLLISMPAIPAYAVSIYTIPNKGKIGDWIEIRGGGFEAGKIVLYYFSSDKADVGDNIDKEVTAYKCFNVTSFSVPDKLTDGRYQEDVHGGDYYIYAIYSGDKEIIAWTHFVILDGEIVLAPEEGTVGSEVKISGEGLRPNQKISAKCDDDKADIISGDRETDSKGQFTCTIIIPDSAAGSHTITVIDESGNKPEAKFSVKPKITLDPIKQAMGKAVTVNGTGFDRRDDITILVGGSEILTTPLSIHTSNHGSFSASFLVPFHYGSGAIKIEASDGRQAEAQLTILAGITLDPITSPTSPGHVGMELIVRGAGFSANSPVSITYTNNDEVIPVATVTADANGGFSSSFTVPPSVAGSHVITVTDGSSIATFTFTMESQAPPASVLLLPEVTTTAKAETHFDWKDVTDPSGVSYTLQVASDVNFTNVVLEKEGLPHSKYTLAEGEKLKSAGRKAYYWRVRAVDGASNEGEWTTSGLFYVGSFWASIPNWVWYSLFGLVILLAAVIGFWIKRRRSE